ncbi:MAG: hypothetical protein H7311_00540 [Ramlibacter sp.]|nr:hypothetical protein [Cryobacterium sp.]
MDDEIAGQTRSRLVGEDALGYLQLHGAKTDHVPSHRVLRWAPEYAIVEMISSKLLERSPRQRRGLEQRGIASQNLKFAKSFMQLLEAEGFVITPSARSETVEITALGRSALGAIVGGRGLNGAIEGLLRGHQ